MFLHRLTHSSTTHPFVTLALAAVYAVVFSYGMGQTEIVNGFRSYLGPASPELQRLDAFVDRFGGGVPALAVYDCESSPACDSVFDPVPLEMAHRIAEELSGLAGVTVYTPANTRLLVFDGEDHFDWVRLYGHPDLESLAALAADDPLWERLIVSKGGRVGAIVLQFDRSDAVLQREATLRLKTLTDRYSDRFEFRFVGESVDFTLGTDAIKAEQDRVMPGLMVAMCLTIFFLFRGAAAIVPTLAVMGLATVGAQGLMGLLGIAVDATTQNVLSVVLVVGICDAIHFIARYASTGGPATQPRSPERIEALTQTAREIETPCFWTTATTVGAFLSFLLSEFESFRYFGLFCAFGILVALLLTFTVMPALLLLTPRLERIPGWDIDVRRTNEQWSALSESLVGMGSERRNRVLVGAGVLLVVFLIGASRVQVDSDIGSLMGNANPLIEWSDWIENNFRSPESLEIEIEMDESTSVLDPESLAIVEDVERHLESSYSDLGEVRSVLDPIRRMNFFMNGSQPGTALIPSAESPERLHAIFFQLGPEIRDQWVPTGRRHVRLSAEAPSISTSQQRLIVESVSSYLEARLPDGWSFRLTGSLPIFEAMMTKLLETQVKAFLGASLTVAVCLFIYFGFAWRLTLLALLPNVLPVVAVMGFLGWGGVPLDIGTAIVGPLVLGIAVDDTIHLFTEYRNAAAAGRKPTEAIRRALQLVDRPIITSSGTLCAGFLTLAVLTRFGVIQTFGVVFSLAIFTAVVADLVLIPALVHRFPNAIAPRSTVR